jgi:signal transduction histidine kinase
MRDLTKDPRAYGFPPHHPRMTSFLGVPVRVRGGRVFGNLYATDKLGAPEFTQEDEEFAVLLAAQAAVAIENVRLYQERTIFTAIVNHEIKNAVAGVLGWSERLRRLTQHLDPDVAEAADLTREAAGQLHRLVSDLLELSRIESGSAELQVRETDLRAMVREVLAALRPSAETREVQLEAEGLDRAAILYTDPQRARQILVNLVSNAIKFTPPRTHVTVRLRSTDGNWAIDVTDQGPGVPAGKRERIFEAYEHAEETHRSLGTGLGLTISRALARLLGGDVTVGDAPGAGALFTLHLAGSRYGVPGDGS